MQYKIYMPFIHGTPAKQWRLVGTLEQIESDTLDIAMPNSGQCVEINFVTSATIKITDALSIGVVVIENERK
ncbi:hypothetical protein Rctr71_078 [Virus Rctr71]|nr:hypothetical protein Rctr71_078 [Virus Rctr71]